jgi:type III pantothenate kinase
MNSRLVIDVGNTSIAFGLFSNNQLLNPECISTNEVLTSEDIDSFLQSYLSTKTIDFNQVVICCGVARINKILEGCTSFKNLNVSYLSGKNAGGAVINYETPETLGPDRIANTIAAVGLYGSPALVIDCGTAINIDFINSDGEFSGGIISPGLQTSRDALSSHAPALPEVQIKSDAKLIGQNTVECIQSGLIYGAVSLIDYVIREVHKTNQNMWVIVTGGHGSIIDPLLESKTELDEWMTLKGLGLARV